jgi:hypothetical protein
LSQWGDPKNKSGDYVVQPSWFPENKVKFQPPPGAVNYSLRWEASAATFGASRNGSGDPHKRMVSTKTFTTSIPTPGNELANIDFCEFEHAKVPLHAGAEVVIEKFQYLP